MYTDAVAVPKGYFGGVAAKRDRLPESVYGGKPGALP